MKALRTADEPWGRLPWLVTIALPVTLLSMMGFLGLLERPLSVSSTLPPVDVQVIEAPAAISASVPREALKAAPTRTAKRKAEPATTRPVPSAAAPGSTPSVGEPERDTRPPVSAPTA